MLFSSTTLSIALLVILFIYLTLVALVAWVMQRFFSGRDIVRAALIGALAGTGLVILGPFSDMALPVMIAAPIGTAFGWRYVTSYCNRLQHGQTLFTDGHPMEKLPADHRKTPDTMTEE